MRTRQAAEQQPRQLQQEVEREEELADGLGDFEQLRQLSDPSEGGFATISDQGLQIFSSDSEVHGGRYIDTNLRPHQRKVAAATPSKTALSMTIGRFLD